MPTGRQGSIHLFKFAGVDVFLHWSWFLVAIIEINQRSGAYTSLSWNVLEYLALFLIVTMHEYGHALACRQVGGVAERIVLWPLGGVAYVNPPQRPGATLWSIAAGPLVNVALVPVTLWMSRMSRFLDPVGGISNVHALLRTVFYINFGLLLFNILPIYPLDGGQILRSLLWYVLGRARSLMVAAVIGVLSGAAFVVYALKDGSIWLLAIAGFMLLNSWAGIKGARAMGRVAALPRRAGFSCPSCHAAPPIGDFWKCYRCLIEFDTFAFGGKCPQCNSEFPVTACPDCGTAHPFAEWTPTTIAASQP